MNFSVLLENLYDDFELNLASSEVLEAFYVIYSDGHNVIHKQWEMTSIVKIGNNI